jgi:hypothetical protein
MALPRFDPDDGFEILTSDEDAWAVFDSASRRMLGMPGEEFLRLWDNGAFAGLGEESPFGRRVNEMTFLLLAVSPERVDAGRGGMVRG